MKEIEKLTSQQEQDLVEFHDKMMRIGRATGAAKIEIVTPIINEFYRRCWYDAPLIWHCQSPMQAQLLINLFLHNGNNLQDNPHNILRENLSDNLWGNLWGNLHNILRGTLSDNLSDDLYNILRGILSDILRGILSDNLGRTLSDNLGDNLTYHHELCSPFNNMNWLAFYLFPHLHLRQMHTDEQMELMNMWMGLMENAGYIYTFNGIAFVCDRPSEIHLDAEGRLHNEAGMAMRFSDGYGFYSWHGLTVPEKVILQPETLTKEKIINEPSAEIRRAMMERVGGIEKKGETK